MIPLLPVLKLIEETAVAIDSGKDLQEPLRSLGQKETKVTDLCSELAVTRQTLYRHVAPDGTLRKDGLKVVEGGKIRSGKKK